MGWRLRQTQAGGESEGGEVGETPEEADLVAAGGREAVDDEGGPSDLQNQVEAVNPGHQEADDDSDHCGHQSATQRNTGLSPSHVTITFSF